MWILRSDDVGVPKAEDRQENDHVHIMSLEHLLLQGGGHPYRLLPWGHASELEAGGHAQVCR